MQGRVETAGLFSLWVWLLVKGQFSKTKEYRGVFEILWKYRGHFVKKKKKTQIFFFWTT